MDLGVLAACPLDPSNCMNHSCDPTSWFVDEKAHLMTACRDIQAGEEVTYDYATSETLNSFHAKWDCRCGGKNCRGKIVTGKEAADEAFVERYWGHLAPHVAAMCLPTHQRLQRKEEEKRVGRVVRTVGAVLVITALATIALSYFRSKNA
jgi:hypothetical protein